MNREFEFRAWLTKYNKMVNIYSWNIWQEYFMCSEYDSEFYLEETPIMQYTGLKDKNNKEIYEGDILFESFGERYYKVVFENGSFKAEFEGDFEEYSFDLIDVVAQGCEVVGNIYENPELLKVIE
nr:MAG TPA: YopX protein [Caudoviricetes sp.]